MIGRILCIIGLHKNRLWHRWVPPLSEKPRIVEDYYCQVSCDRCGKVHHRKRVSWYGREMVDAPWDLDENNNKILPSGCKRVDLRFPDGSILKNRIIEEGP